jgi:hypothetical protein
MAPNVYCLFPTPERLQLTTNLLTVWLLSRLKGLGGSMERRYLVAALAVVATFAVTSHGFRALQQVSLGSDDQHFWIMSRVAAAGAMAKARCEADSAQAMAKLRTHLRPRYPEEAQLLAEMNVPIAGLQSTIAQQMARQDAALARCARARAMQEAERAQREAMRMQQQMTRAKREANIAPMSLELNLPADLDQRIQAQIQAQTAAIAARVAANKVKLQIAADKMGESSLQLENLDVPVVEVTDDGGRISTHVHTHVNCNATTKKQAGRQPQ